MLKNKKFNELFSTMKPNIGMDPPTISNAHSNVEIEEIKEEETKEEALINNSVKPVIEEL